MSFNEIKLSEEVDPEYKETEKEFEEDLVEEAIIEHEDHTDLEVTFFLFVMLIAGGIMKELSSIIGIPYTSLLTVIGLLLGILAEAYPH